MSMFYFYFIFNTYDTLKSHRQQERIQGGSGCIGMRKGYAGYATAYSKHR
jgi:hypothetical protein